MRILSSTNFEVRELAQFLKWSTEDPLSIIVQLNKYKTNIN